MEVHHHSSTPRKKLKHYLFEFLMLFLAVFAGFVAENIREHSIERKREKQYIRSLIDDIKTDVANANRIAADYDVKLVALDSIIAYFNEFMTGYSRVFFRNIRVTSAWINFYPTDRTMQQLKNAGGLRLIHKHRVSDSIMHYDAVVRDVVLEQAHLGSFHFDKIANMNMQHFDGYKYDSLTRILSWEQMDQLKPSFFVETSKPVLIEYYTRLQNLKAAIRLFKEQLNYLVQEGNNMISFLKEEY